MAISRSHSEIKDNAKPIEARHTSEYDSTLKTAPVPANG